MREAVPTSGVRKCTSCWWGYHLSLFLASFKRNSDGIHLLHRLEFAGPHDLSMSRGSQSQTLDTGNHKGPVEL